MGFIDYLSSNVGGLGQGESDTVIAINPLDLHRNTLRSMWVFSDIVADNLVYNMSVPLLRFMPVDSTSHQISFETFSALMYKPISKSIIQDIRIWFSESHTGEPIQLSADSVVRLQFDRVK